MRKVIDYLYIVLFLGILLIPLFFMNTKPYSVSETDNRTLAYAPDFGKKDFRPKFETYLKDRIGFRDEMITAYAKINDTVAGDLSHPLYENGKDGYIFFGMHNVIRYGDYHRTFAEFVKAMQDYCEARGIRFYFAFEPEKTSVMRQYLPDGVNYDDSWVEEMLGYMDELGVHYIDNKSLLMEKSKSEQVFNVKYDAGHWNDLGSFYATNHILSRIHEDFPEITELSKDEFTISTEVAQYLPVSHFEINETVPKFTLKETWTDSSTAYSDGLDLNPSYKHFHYYTSDSEGAKSLPRLLMFQGSYYNRGTQFFADRASEYIGVHSYQNVIDLDYYVNAFDPDIVIFEAAEYTFTDTYYNRTRMRAADWNPPLVDAREETPVEEQLDEVLASAVPMEERNLYVLEYTDLEKVYMYDDGFRSAQYLYLLADGRILDLQKDSFDTYSAMIDTKTDLKHTYLLVVEYDGSRKLYPLTVQRAHFLQSDISEATSNIRPITDPYLYVEELGVLHNATEFTTDMKGNSFSSIEIQLISLATREYCCTLYSTASTGDKSGALLITEPTGWYRLRFKVNSSKQDEYIDYITFLEGGEYYPYSFVVDKLDTQHVVVSDFSIYGPGFATPCDEVLPYTMDMTDHAVPGNDREIMFTTDVSENSFSSAILSVLPEDAEDFRELYSASTTGVHHGYYTNFEETGACTIKIRANSNIKDESASFYYQLEKDALYEYSFELVEIDEKKVVIRNFQLKKISEVTE